MYLLKNRALIVFVVSQNEKNIGDQRMIEYKCIELEPLIKVIRLTINDIHKKVKLDEQKRLIL